MVHGEVGVLGNSYWGMKASTTKGIVEEVAGGFTGLLVCSFVVALIFTANFQKYLLKWLKFLLVQLNHNAAH